MPLQECVSKARADSLFDRTYRKQSLDSAVSVYGGIFLEAKEELNEQWHDLLGQRDVGHAARAGPASSGCRGWGSGRDIKGREEGKRRVLGKVA